MFFSRALFAGIALFSFVTADPKVAFTSVPAVVSGGETYNIAWGGGDGTSVTITLRKGDPDDLDTVGILADGTEGYSYNWTVSRSLKAGDDYALQITQGQDQINYSGQFSLVAADSTSTTSAVAGASSTMSSNSSMTTTVGLGSNSTANSTISTSSLPRTITTTPATSAHTPSASGASSVSSGTSAESTSAPDSGAVQMTSSAAFAVAVIAAVMFFI